MAQLKTAAAVRAAAHKAVAAATASDIHTHLFPPSHGDLLLWGVDEMLTYHYLVAELMLARPHGLTPQKFYALGKQRQAELVWEHVFRRNSPLSEAARGVLTTLSALGLDVARRDLGAVRRWFAAQKIDRYFARVFKLAGLDYAVMTNNPFNQQEAAALERGLPVPGCLRTALRIDTLVLNWPAASQAMREQGYRAGARPAGASLAAARKFLADWARRIKPVYMAASLGSDFAYPARGTATSVLEQVVLPAARELGLPVALMIGVRRGVNPALGDAGDGMGVADVAAVENLCRMHGDVKFLVTMLARVNQHELCVAARKFSNLHVFGCWWFCNNPSIIDETTRMRLELLGTAFTAQHSDARVLDQLIYKWAHSRAILGRILAEKYCDLLAAGWPVSQEEMRRDVRLLLGGSFERFVGPGAR